MGSAASAGSGGSTVSSLAGGVVSAFGQQASLTAQANADFYQAKVEGLNAAIANNNAAIASQAAEQQVTQAGIGTKALTGAETVNSAAGGMSVNAGSNVGVRGATSELGQLDEYTTRAEGVKKAFGYETQAEGFKAQQGLAQAAGEQAKASIPMAMATSILGGGTQAGTSFSNFLSQGGFNSGSGLSDLTETGSSSISSAAGDISYPTIGADSAAGAASSAGSAAGGIGDAISSAFDSIASVFGG